MNVSEIVNFLEKEENLIVILKEFASKNPEKNVLKLLNLIPNLVAIHVSNNNTNIREMENALKDAVCNKISGQTFDSKQFVITNWRIVKSLFPKAKITTHCELEKQYFQLFTAALEDQKELIDSVWAKHVAENNDYLKNFAKENFK